MSTAPKPIAVPNTPAPGPSAQPAGHEPKRPQRWPWLLVGGLVVGGASWMAYQYRDPDPAAQQAAGAAVIQTTVAKVAPVVSVGRITGQTSSGTYLNISAPVLRGPEGGRDMVLMQLAKSGSLVKKGEIIAQLDAQPLRDHVDDLADTIQQAENDISKRKAEQAVEWENLQQNLRVAKSALDKAKLELSASEVKTAVDRELLKLTVDEAEANYKQQSESINVQKAGHQAELRILGLTLERHRRHRNRHISDLEKFTVHASMSGLVVMDTTWRGDQMAQIQQGDRIFPGQRFMKIVDPTNMQVEGTVNQAEIGLFRVGLPAKVRLDAFPGLELSGRIYSIGALAVSASRQSNYIRTVPVRVKITGADPRLIPDLSAAADIVIDSNQSVLQIPLAAVSQEDGKNYVYVKKGERFERREVQLGTRNHLQAAVKSGIQSGEEVALSKPSV